jgi:hypothetical protein
MNNRINIEKVKELARAGFTCSQIANSMSQSRQAIWSCGIVNAIAFNKTKTIVFSVVDIEDMYFLFNQYKSKKKCLINIYKKYGYGIQTVIEIENIIKRDSSQTLWKFKRSIALSKQPKSLYTFTYCRNKMIEQSKFVINQSLKDDLNDSRHN